MRVNTSPRLDKDTIYMRAFHGHKRIGVHGLLVTEKTGYVLTARRIQARQGGSSYTTDRCPLCTRLVCHSVLEGLYTSHKVARYTGSASSDQ